MTQFIDTRLLCIRCFRGPVLFYLAPMNLQRSSWILLMLNIATLHCWGSTGILLYLVFAC